MNDSILAQSYVEAYDISYPEALNRIDAEVDELKQALERDGFYELSDIGVLTINSEGKYEFEPCESGILTPELYGLAGFEINKLAIEEGNEDANKTLVELPIEPKAKPVAKSTVKVGEGCQTSNSPFGESVLVESLTPAEPSAEKTISIKVSVLRNVVAVACAVIAFFVMTTPITTDVKDNVKEASSINYSLLYNLIPKNGGSGDIILNNERAKVAYASSVDGKLSGQVKRKVVDKQLKANVDENIQKNEAALRETIETKEQSDVQQKREYYSIVLACRITKANADAFVERLHADGYKKACVIGKEGLSLKVVYGSYRTEKEAFTELNALRVNKLFEDSWIFHVK